MILVDTSVWIDHFRRMNRRMYDLLEAGDVLCHPFVVGELACGHLPERMEILRLINELPMAIVVKHDEALAFIERNGLVGRGIGWVDVHLLASSLISGCKFWSLDKPLARAARTLHVALEE